METVWMNIKDNDFSQHYFKVKRNIKKNYNNFLWGFLYMQVYYIKIIIAGSTA